MHTNSKDSVKMKVFPKGQVVIPAALRKKYQIDIGDQIEAFSKPEGIFLKPVSKDREKVSMTEQLFGLFSEYASKNKQLSKEKIARATGAGFREGWKE